MLDRRSTCPLDRSHVTVSQTPRWTERDSRPISLFPLPLDLLLSSPSPSPSPRHPHSIRDLSLQNWRWVDVGKLEERASPIRRARISNRTVSHFACNGRSHSSGHRSATVRMWVISIAAEIGPITPTIIERCNYSATNDKKKRKKEQKGITHPLSLSSFWSLEDVNWTWRIVGNIKTSILDCSILDMYRFDSRNSVVCVRVSVRGWGRGGRGEEKPVDKSRAGRQSDAGPLKYFN